MRNFLIGLFAGIAVVVVAAFCYVRFGLVDSRADIPVNALEERIAMPSLDASVDRYAPEIKNPIDATAVNLIAGMRIYQADCASCHGDVNHPEALLSNALYPRAPQFVRDSPDMPENQNFYIIQHGIRLSGMPAWTSTLSDEQIWQVTTFLARMHKLPPQVSNLWKAAANGPSEATTFSQPSQSNNMKMPMK